MKEEYLELDNLSETSESILFETPRFIRIFTYLTTALFTALLVWSYFTIIDEIVVASAVVRPRGDVHVVHAPLIGKIAQVFVKEGDEVKRGDRLLGLDARDIDLKISGLKSRIQSERQKLDSLLAQKAVIARQGESAILGAKHKVEAATVEISRLLSEQKELTVRLRQADVERVKAAEALERAKAIAALISKAELESVQADLDLKRSSYDVLQAKLEENANARNAAEVKLKEARTEATYEMEKLQNTLKEHELKIKELNILLNDLESQLALYMHSQSETVITAPVAGVITLMSVKNPGQVLSAGQHVASIAPRGSELIIEAYVPNKDAGQVRVGHAANVKVEAYPYQDYGVIAGKVSYLAKDSRAMDSGSYYRSELTINPDSNKKIELQPGMSATVEIITSTERISIYFLKKIKRQIY